MKANLFCLAILLLSLSLGAQSRGIEFYLYNSDNIRLLESSLGYQTTPFKDVSMDILGQSSWEERLNFNQNARRSMLGSYISYQRYRLLHGLSVNYESYYDASDLDPNSYVNKNGKLGYQIWWNPVDSLSLGIEAHGLIRNEQDRYLVGNHLKSDGLQLLSHASYRLDEEFVSAGMSARIERKEMDWEKYQDASAQASFMWLIPGGYWDNSFAISQRQDEIYNLYSDLQKQNSSYQKQDTQKRNQFSIYSRLDYYPHDLISLSLSENYSEKRTRLSENTVRNNGEFYNELQMLADYELRHNLKLSGEAGHQLAIKDFSYAENTRHVETRQLSGTASWEYAEQDSLIASLGINLQRTHFPSNEHRWDNDLRNRNFRLGLKHYLFDYIRLSNWFLYTIREDVYMDSLLSANNHHLESISFAPEIDILMGDRVVLRQAYQIRADYTDYHYPKDRVNKLYRQVGYAYNLIFDSYPYIARSGDDKWLRLPYRRNSSSAFMLDIGYAYEENQYADQAGEVYVIKDKNREHQSSLTLKHNIGDFYYSLSNLYTWGTWKEYSVEASANWDFDNGSWLQISIAPISEDLKDINWRSSVNLNLRF